MADDREVLEKLNVDIGTWESDGNRAALERILAPELAFQRANDERTVVGKQAFLDAVEKSSARTTEVTSVTPYGNRAVVECIVTRDGKRTHNLRLFVRRDDGWKLLGWANEPASAAPLPGSVEGAVA